MSTTPNAAAALADAAELIRALEQARRHGPPLVYGQVNNADFEISDTGALTIGPHAHQDMIKLTPELTYALYIWFAKYPHVAALLERLSAERHAASWVRVEQQDRATDRRNAERLADEIAARRQVQAD